MQIDGDNYGFEEQFEEIDSNSEELNEVVEDNEEGYESEDGEESDELESSEESEDTESDEYEEEFEDVVEEEYEIEVADYIEDDFIPPDKFKNQKEEVRWYKENYARLINKFSDEDFVQEFADAYQEQLLSREKNIENLKAVDYLLKGQPELALKLYAPQYLAQKGHSPLINEDEAREMVDNALKQKYGEDYLDLYDSSKANTKGTLSYMMYQYQQEILHHVQQQREEAQKYIENYQPPDPAKIQEYLYSVYEESFAQAEFSKEEFDNFVSEAREYSKTMPLEDVYFVLNKEDYLDLAYENGYEEGKKAAAKNLNKAIKSTNYEEQPTRRVVRKADNGVKSFTNKYSKIKGF